MDQNLVKALIFLAGIGVGGLATGLFMKIYYGNRMDSEYQSMKEYYDRKIMLLTKEEDADAEVKEEIQSIGSVFLNPKEALRGAAMMADDPDLNKHIAERENPTDEEEEDIEFTDVDFDEYNEIVKQYNDPQASNFTLLGETEYYTNPKGYDQETLYFYDEDDVLLREDESIITDIDNTVGYDSLTRFGEDENQPDIIYVRNNYRKTEYEIIRMRQSYSRDFLGIKED